ncbi:hypothetical protein J40TS1_14250 [Paenibacillus montaniterrae]|uniref:Adenine DNA glycosylase n=1 Tax=Paenibacillus montaniterrae TaxID=429341 RepID=A0A919YRU8_9BACL|nr:A/G-specific adenine glycosylase [Paenibacillus montaniterrae]GIP15783.1 hypothetical protein J40TS1_14250 [Paenibacillus montaniterrae]
MTQLSLEQKKEMYGQNLLEWYHHIQRDLPWRKNHDPYRIWVSEIMLQQTRVDTVIPYFNAFISKFPTVKVLAEAPEEEVLKCWEGLGYYSRARNLQAGAKMVMELHHGQMPTTKEEVAALKGVGPYTCGAIMSIAYNEPIPAVDGNVMRVISRFFALDDDIAKPSTRIKLEKLVETMIPQGQARYFNQALMELGALICTPKSPNCLLCPVMEHCEARLQGREHELPIKSKAKKARVEYRVAAIVEGQGEHAGKVLVRQRPAEGLLAGMWELPHVLVADEQAAVLYESELKEQPELGRAIAEELHTQHGLLVRPRQWFCDQDHIFSHIRWNMRFFIADSDPEQLTRLEALEFGSNESSPLAGINADESNLQEVAAGLAADGLKGTPSSAALVAEKPMDYTANENRQSSKNELRFIAQKDMDSLPFPNLFLKILQKYWQSKGEA